MLLASQDLPGNEFNFSEVHAGVHVFHEYHYLFIVSARDPNRYSCRCAVSEFVCVFCNVVVGGI